MLCMDENILKAQAMLNVAKQHHSCEKKKDIFSAYNVLYKQGIFSSRDIASYLFSIQDDSYSYIGEFICGDCTKKSLLNVFSGSGRLFQALDAQSKLKQFNEIHSVDSSFEMIEFQKSTFGSTQISYVCQDVLKVSNSVLKYDVAICHCGVRYLNYSDYLAFLKKMILLKREKDSVCIITEVDEQIVLHIIECLKQLYLPYKHKMMRMRLQRNTSLYIAINLYQSDAHFRELVDEIVTQRRIKLWQALPEIAGYKDDIMHVLSF